MGGDLIDIGFAATKAGRQRQRHRQGAGINGGKEGSSKAGTGFGDERHPIPWLHAIGDQPQRLGPRIGGDFAIWIGTHQIGTGVMKVHALVTETGIIQSFAKRGERGALVRQRVKGGCRFKALVQARSPCDRPCANAGASSRNLCCIPFASRGRSNSGSNMA